MRIAAIILAAGRGTRFGAEPKLLAELEGRPLVRHAAEAALASRARPVLAVLGHRREEVGGALDGLPVERIDNPRFQEGLSTSLQAGFAALPEGVAGAVVCLADMPWVTPAVIDRLIEAFERAGRPAAVVPVTGGRRGNPVLLSGALLDQIMTLAGDRGAGPLLAGRADVVEVPVDDAGVLADVDTPDALPGPLPERP